MSAYERIAAILLLVGRIEDLRFYNNERPRLILIKGDRP